MKPSDFTNEVHHVVKNLRAELLAKHKAFSDIIADVDDAGDGIKQHQYVDLVMEGGGVLGIALVGFTYVLEQVGIRFLRVGGASAGAINALLLAGLDEPHRAKSEEIVNLLANLDMYSFVDGDEGVRELIEAWVKEAGRFRLGVKALYVWDDVRDHLGLNPGEVFRNWMAETLGQAGITTTRELRERMRSFPKNLRRRDGAPLTIEADVELALVAADVSTETKVIFPKMAPLYWADPDGVNPAEYVRASMSIPFFFYPFRIENVPQGKEAMDRWAALASYTQTPPRVCILVDGGIMSNFPIDIFHRPDRIPAAPTFGIKLGTNERRTGRLEQPSQLAGAIFNSARHCLDYDFIARNPDYQKLVTCIDTAHHNWLDFRMSPEEKVDLFTRGARAAAAFLRDFDWDDYKKIRKGIASAVRAADAAESSAGPAAPEGERRH